MADENAEKSGKYLVYIDENDENGEGEQRYILGEYDSILEAEEAAKQVIDNFLLANYQPGLTAQDLFDAYTAAGQEPWVPGSPFKAWDYVIERSREIAEGGGW